MMEKRHRVILYGSSVFIAGVEASLADRPGLDVVRVDATLPDAEQRLVGLRPGVVIFDLTVPDSPSAVSFLKEHPGLSLIGLDPNSDTVYVLSSQQHTVLTAGDLARVIEQAHASDQQVE